MPLTHHPHGVSSFGIPMLGGIAGMPFTGDYYFVEPQLGKDGNSGEHPGAAMKTLAAALAKCTSGNNDVIILIGDGTTTHTARLDENLAWNKDATHLMGITAPTGVSQRARIAATSGEDFTNLVTVTGDGCMFFNFSTFHGYETDEGQICWTDQGERNYYGNVQFGGFGGILGADNANSRALVIGAAGTGRGEHTFENCVIGLDTRTRGAANASVELLGATPRNTFRKCIFPAHLDAGTPVFVTVGTGGMDRWALFDECSFFAFGTTMTQAFSAGASAGGNILLQNCGGINMTDWSTSANVVYTNLPAGNEAGGIGVASGS